MSVSLFEIFSIGIGPSSSHTVGPMVAAKQFLEAVEGRELLRAVASMRVDLYGSLALTGRGHCCDAAILFGLMGVSPEVVERKGFIELPEQVSVEQRLQLLGRHPIYFNPSKDIVFNVSSSLPHHPNGMRFTAYDAHARELLSKTYYSRGGGFVVEDPADTTQPLPLEKAFVPYPFATAEQLLQICTAHGLTIAEVMMANEQTWRSRKQVECGILDIWQVMQECVQAGCQTEGVLPGGLNVKRRAVAIYQALQRQDDAIHDPAVVMDWVSLWALAVSEENASAGRVVTAPTNGSAGIIPAVLHYYERFTEAPSDDGIVAFFLTAAAIAILYKTGASISAAEMGCQGEVGVACSMAAAGLVAALGGTVHQVENAAEIGMEHNLGLTCDPVKGLVQVPCIERNTMGAVKAIMAGRLALRGNGVHKVSLDQVISTMRQVGHDMKSLYKKTSQGGLAVNVVEC